MAEVFYSCPYVPIELIAACGHTARRPEPAAHGPTVGAETEGLCAWAAACVETLSRRPDLGAAVFTTACDQMRRAYELFRMRSERPAFLLNVPKTSGPTALAMFADEIRRLTRFLNTLDGGTNGQGEPSCTHPTPAIQTPVYADTGLAVVGGPLFDADLNALGQHLGRFSQRIVFDCTESAWSRYRTPCDPARRKTAPIETLAEHYLSTPAVWRRPAEPFFDWLATQLKTHRAEGVIVILHPFCDYWRAAVYDLKSRLDVPVVTLETGEGGHFSSAALSRLEAFLEQCQR